jgi:hypothetical protein
MINIKKTIKNIKGIGALGPGAKKEMKIEKDDLYRYPVVVKMDSTVGKKRIMYSKIDFGNTRKIVIPMSQKLYSKTVQDTTENFSNLFYEIPIDKLTEEEIQNIKNFCNSETLQILSEFIAKVIGSLRYWKIPEEAKTPLTEEEIQDLLGIKDDWDYILSIPKLQGQIKSIKTTKDN